ncbi:hypothetical protein [Chryseobacterium sp.]|uniref:hypothetical protein n=1 Tax=Chryseobacterium sp. TaxID=1871047 RepID=UPI002FC786CF
MNNTLPTNDLIRFGILDSNNSFSKKLSPDDIQRFLLGDTLIADNDKSRITFQLTNNNTELKVDVFEREYAISELLEKTKREIQYSTIESKYNINNEQDLAHLAWSKTAFVFDKENQKIIEYDMIKNSSELTQLISDRNNSIESNTYKTELLQLKDFLQQKMEQYPEIAKKIAVDLNIVSHEISSMKLNYENPFSQENNTDVQLNVNDPDLYEDANRNREFEEIEENWEKPRGRGR